MFWNTTIKKIKNLAEKGVDSSVNFGKKVGMTATKPVAVFGAFLSQDQLLSWAESISKAPATIYDKAMDAEYLRSHIGGGNHRMFDGGHSLSGAWERVINASGSDHLSQEVVGYVNGIWKDGTTLQGLPFVTMDKANFDGWATWAAAHIPGVDKGFFYDLLSFDAFEVLSAGLGAVGLVFALRADDKKKLAEILGSMGIIAILSANPIMGLVVIATSAYAYFIKKREFDAVALVEGSAVAVVSMTTFALLGLPVLVELIIVIVLVALLKKQVFERVRFAKKVTV